MDGERLGGDARYARVSLDGQTNETWPPSMNIITCGAVDPNAATSNRWTTPTIDAVTSTENASTAIAGKKMGQNSTSGLIAVLQSHCTATSMLSHNAAKEYLETVWPSTAITSENPALDQAMT